MNVTKLFSGGRRLDGPVALLMVGAVLGAAAAYQREAAWAALGWLAGGAGVYGLVSRRGEEGRLTLRIAIMVGGAVGLYLVTQIGDYADLNKIALVEAVTDRIAGLMPDLAVWKPAPNSAATLLEGLFFLGIGAALTERSARWRKALWAASGLIGAGLAACESRGAWMALVGAGLSWLALRYRLARYAAGVTVIGLAALAAAVLLSGDLSILERLPVVNRTLGPIFFRPDRLEVYRGAIQLIEELPLSGVGLGDQFAMNYSKFVLLIEVPYLTYSHHFFLESWLELGLAGAVGAVWLAAAVGAAGVKLRGRRDLLTQGIWAGAATMGLHGLTDARMYVDGWCWLPMFFLLGMLARREDRPEPGEKLVWNRWNWRMGLAGTAQAVGVSILLLSGAVWTNLGALKQARAELSPTLGERGRAALIASAEADFRRSLARNPEARGPNLRLGLLFSSEDRFDEALGPLETALRANPTSPTSRKALGLAYMWMGRLDEAADLVSDARNIVDELNAWGRYRASQEQVELAKRAFELSLRLEEDQEDIQRALSALE